MLVELAQARPEYYFELIRQLLEMLSQQPFMRPSDELGELPSVHLHEYEQWPLDDQRSSTGFVGLKNLGATCYMNTSLQHLFMIPLARNALLRQDLVLHCTCTIIVLVQYTV